MITRLLGVATLFAAGSTAGIPAPHPGGAPPSVPRADLIQAQALCGSRSQRGESHGAWRGGGCGAHPGPQVPAPIPFPLPIPFPEPSPPIPDSPPPKPVPPGPFPPGQR